MSTTTGPMLLAHADRLARDLVLTETAMTLHQWETFDNTVYQLLHALVGPERRMNGGERGVSRAVFTTLHAYPNPLRPARCEVYSAFAAGRFLGQSHSQVVRSIRRGAIQAGRTPREFRIDARQLDTRPDLTPALSTDRHPVARPSVTFGALNDLLASQDGGRGRLLSDDVQIAAVMRHVLSIASVVARYAIANCPIADADRPLRVAQYAGRAVDALAGPEGYPQLWEAGAVSPPQAPRSLNDRLELALADWAAAARADLNLQIPSTDVIRNITATGVHMLAVTDALLKAQLGSSPGLSEDMGQTRPEVKATALALNGAGRAWAPLTTGMTPSHQYVSSSRSLFAALREAQVALGVSAEETEPFDIDRALHDLVLAVRELSLRMTTIDSLSARLLRSELLFIRARTIEPRAELITDRAKGRLVVARPQDAPNLVEHTRQARERSYALSLQFRPHMPSANDLPQSVLVALIDAPQL